MLNRAFAVARALLAIFASRTDLILENLALRQQLSVLRRKHPRPRLRLSDRLFWLAPRRGWPRWKETLANHREAIAAIDFFTVPTATFRVLYIFFIVHHARRVLLHFRVTGHPTAAWITQQLREAFPYDQAPRYLILDRDAKYGNEVITAIRAMGIEPNQITARSPWQNGVAERFAGTARRDLLDHVIVLNEKQLQRLLAGFAWRRAA